MGNAIQARTRPGGMIVATSHRRAYRPMQQAMPCWTGGHGTEPYEQNTQQSPAFGLTTLAHAGQSRKNWQALVGILIVLHCLQYGQVSWQSSFNAV